MRVAVIGAGPAGMMAAMRLAEKKIDTTLFDEQPSAGGQIYRHVANLSQGEAQQFGDDYAIGANLVQRFQSLASNPSLTPIHGATVWSVSEDRNVAWSVDGKSFSQAFDAIILATGALERAMPLPGWTNPGVMTAGAAQILMKTAGYAPQNAVLIGSGPLLYLVATQMLTMGKPPIALLETQSVMDYGRAALKLRPSPVVLSYMLKGLRMLRQLSQAGVARHKAVSDVKISSVNDKAMITFSQKGQEHQIEAETVLLHAGVQPNIQLSQSLGLAHQWNGDNQCWEPEIDAMGRTSKAHIYIAGDGGGILGADAAKRSGQLAAMAVMADLDVPVDAAEIAHAIADHRRYRSIRGFLDTLYAPKPWFQLPHDDTIICRCEEVTAGTVRGAVHLGCLGPNQLKAFSRCGMGNCQGRYCGHSVVNLIADVRDLTPEEVGYYRIRSPIKPVTLEEIAHHDIIN